MAHAAMGGGESDEKEKKLPTIAAQKETLREFLEQPTRFKVGDFVRLNRFGKMRYKYPNDRQVGVVSAVFDTAVLDRDSQVVHGEVVVVHGDHLQAYAMDFRVLSVVKK